MQFCPMKCNPKFDGRILGKLPPRSPQKPQVGLALVPDLNSDGCLELEQPSPEETRKRQGPRKTLTRTQT